MQLKNDVGKLFMLAFTDCVECYLSTTTLANQECALSAHFRYADDAEHSDLPPRTLRFENPEKIFHLVIKDKERSANSSHAALLRATE